MFIQRRMMEGQSEEEIAYTRKHRILEYQISVGQVPILKIYRFGGSFKWQRPAHEASITGRLRLLTINPALSRSDRRASGIGTPSSPHLDAFLLRRRDLAMACVPARPPGSIVELDHDGVWM